ncbi:MAG: Spy/CpxP family protein refolding chaperone [Pseudomonadota bacterium]
MRNPRTLTAAAMLISGIAATAFAQAPAPAAPPADPHHPEAPAGAQQPPRPGAPGSGAAGMGGGMMGGGMMGGGMMGGDMGRMMQHMMHNRMTAASMQPFRRMEGQLAFLRAELRITEAQLPQWNAFADAVRTQGDRLRQSTQQAMGATTGPGTAPQQMERRIALLSAQTEAMRAVATAATPLYAVLTEEQRRTADELMAEHFRSMRTGMP